jgi:hypothetical protein
MKQPKLLECMGVLKVIYDMFFGRLAFLVKQQQESCKWTDRSQWVLGGTREDRIREFYMSSTEVINCGST